MKTSHLMILSIVFLVLSSDMMMAARTTTFGTLDGTVCKRVTFEVHCDDIKPCAKLCGTQNPLYPSHSLITSIICHNTSECQCTFCKIQEDVTILVVGGCDLSNNQSPKKSEPTNRT
uniref:Uncharacterized protein n=1 Tax=Leersia perrieri TaxID=77586 RepID=A0A0D9XT16_9ORYZ